MNDLPGIFWANALVSMAQDQETLFVYWTFTPARRETLKNFLDKLHADPHLILHLRCPASPVLDQEVRLTVFERGSHYFRISNPTFSYQIELGCKTPEGRFIVLARTQEIILQTPAGNPLANLPCVPQEPAYRPEGIRDIFSFWS